ncbi:uncharacterized protein LOC135470199 [Liolophura sinensis]|uniref:uncharacterized protein LOC135470199 n=1 Tax=Liolophura sinensis TaxID=3198878 RepID=UPI0031583793
MKPLEERQSCNGIVISLHPPSDLDTEDDDDLSRHTPSTPRQPFPTVRHPPSTSSGYCRASDNSLPKPRVKLPSRYLVRLSRASLDPDHNSNTKIDYPNPLPNDKENRERDLEQALKWIRQEILLMREQDKMLRSQFIGLRSRILQFRCWLEIYGSTSDMSSLDGSSMSLEESRSLLSLNSSGHSGGSSLLSPDNELEFRNRTSSMRIVRRPPSICPRISEKRRSKEYA